MVFEQLSANSLPEMTDKVSAYLSLYNPKLFMIDVAEFKRNPKTKKWITTIKRDGKLAI